MFTLGFIGLLLVTAIPLLAIYTLAAVFIALTIAAVNKFSSTVNLYVSILHLIAHAAVAWITSVVLFFALVYANYQWTQYSGNTVFRLYPITQQLFGFLVFLHLLLPAISSKDSRITLTRWQRNSYPIFIALVPTLVLFVVANIREIARAHS